jgi:hypothetical protein
MIARRSNWVLAAAVVLGLLAPGCGASDSSDDATTLTKAGLIKRGDAICQRANELEVTRLEALERSNGAKESTPAEQLREVILPAVRTEMEEIGELHPPRDDEDELKAIVAALEAGVLEGEKNLSSLLDGSSRQFAKAFALMQGYGFKVCGVS